MGEATVKISSLGIRLDAPTAGDIVTVRVKRRDVRHARPSSFSPFGDLGDEAENPQHYRMTGIWKVIAANGGQVVVEGVHGYPLGRREVWPTDLHIWFEASELLAALTEGKPDA